MNEKVTPQITPEDVSKQIDRYLQDPSVHRPGFVGFDDGTRSHNVIGGSASVYRDGVRFGKNRQLGVSGNVDGKELTATLDTHEAGGEHTLNNARTSEGNTKYGTWREGVAHVRRQTEDGSEYVHVFKDPNKVKEASKLITALASKRAARIVEGKADKKAA